MAANTSVPDALLKGKVSTFVELVLEHCTNLSL